MDSVQRLVVLAGEPIAEINPHLHGQFAEHLGELIYPGICVPSGSAIPNTGGIRTDVVEALKPLGISVLRWPGGCFADTYHWRDGIGPCEQRPKRVNVHWGMAEEPNLFGTHEFMAFTRAIGAAPYFAANLGSAPPAETADWVEYCNFSGDSTLADERRANGAAEPFNIKYWGIGNEAWGCGGNMSPGSYADEYGRYATFVHPYTGSDPLVKIACGPNANDWKWTREFFETTRAHPWRSNALHGFAAHYYCGTAGTATQYTDEQWLELLAKAVAVEGVITGHRAIMDEVCDPQRKVRLILDEWGAWHPVEEGKPRGGLYQQNTMRDACVAALSLDLFHQHADKLYMANIAQLINVLQALLLVDDERCIKTPTYHVFNLYKAHKGATALRTIAAGETISSGEGSSSACKEMFRDKQFPGLHAVQGSASVKGKTMTITAVNSHPSEPTELAVELHGGAFESARAALLHGEGNIRAHNTFADQERVTPGRAFDVAVRGPELRLQMPAASVVAIECLLA